MPVIRSLSAPPKSSPPMTPVKRSRTMFFEEEQPVRPIPPPFETQVDTFEDPRSIRFFDYFDIELRLLHEHLNSEESSSTSQSSNFFDVALYLFSTTLFGWMICLDSFLFLFTFLPIRLSFSAIIIFIHMTTFAFKFPFFLVLRQILQIFPRAFKAISSQLPSSGLEHSFYSTFMLDAMRSSIMILVVYFMLCFVDLPQMYHWIRGQSMFKLYVVFNILEIFEKLCCSVGDDILASMYTAGFNLVACLFKEHRVSLFPSELILWMGRFAIEFVISFIYVLVHSVVLIVHIITLNVAINSNDASLMVLLVSNNFVELKSSAFKRFSVQNLFQISSNDMVELFQLTVYIIVILLRNLQFVGWSTDKAKAWMSEGLRATVWILGMEMAIDLIKHSFITKFNRFDPKVFHKFKLILCADCISLRTEPGKQDSKVTEKVHSFVDKSHSVSKRIGFISIPMFCVVMHSTLQLLYGLNGTATQYLYFTAVFAVVFALLVLTKVLVGIFLLGHSIKSVMKSSSASNEQEFRDLNVHRYTLFGKGVPRY